MIDFGFVVYGLLLAGMLGLAVFADVRRRARRRVLDTADISQKF